MLTKIIRDLSKIYMCIIIHSFKGCPVHSVVVNTYMLSIMETLLNFCMVRRNPYKLICKKMQKLYLRIQKLVGLHYADEIYS